MARAPSPAYPAEPRLYGDYYVCRGHVMRRVMTILKPIFFTLTKVDMAKLIIDNYCFELLLDHYWSYTNCRSLRLVGLFQIRVISVLSRNRLLDNIVPIQYDT